MYNLTFTDLADKSGFCYCWDQTVAQRGSNEIGSYINMHLKENIMESEVTHVAYFSDNYPGQNKNRFVYHTLSLSTMIIENLGEVELVFIEKGHTQNANDTMLSLIENAKSPNKPYHVTVRTISLIIRPLKIRNRFFELRNNYELLAFFMRMATAKAEAIIRKRLQHTYTHPSTQHREHMPVQ